MSDSEEARTEAGDRQALARLESAVTRILEETARLRSRVREGETRVAELEALLRRFDSGEDDPAALHQRATRLEAENDELRNRIRKGREGVERLLARIRFLEHQK
jgi:predicted RNase H-like nuclease (RuvC/YqgF family)